jgi:hypothetical protein
MNRSLNAGLPFCNDNLSEAGMFQSSPWAKKVVFGAIIAFGTSGSAFAANIMPDFAGVPAGWTTDRYDPASFSNVGTYQGRTNVLGITTTDAQTLSNRLAGFQSTFRNTQGRGYNLNGGAGSNLAAALYIPATWGNSGNGSRRTDMWGVMTNGTSVTDYPIIGFTNYGGAARFRIWDENIGTSGDWVNLSNTVHYDGWNSLAIDFTGSSYVYSINGSVAFTDNTIGGSTTVSRTLMQVYNFGDPSITGAVVNDYTAHWANAPEPATLSLLGLGFAGLLAARRRRT